MTQITLVSIFVIAYVLIAVVGIAVKIYRVGAKYQVFDRQWDMFTKKFTDSDSLVCRFYKLESAKKYMIREREIYSLLSTGIKNRKTGEIIEYPGNRLRDRLLEIWSSNTYADQAFVDEYLDTHAGPREEFESLPELEGETSKKNRESA